MNTKTKWLTGAAAIICTAGMALATPVVGLVSPLLAVGTHDGDLHAHGSAPVANGEPFHVRFSSDGAATVSTQDFALAAGGHNGWHAHPGMVIVTIISGSITWYDENCQTTEYKAGDSWVEGGQLHAFKVTSPGGLHAFATFITAKGLPLRTDESAPSCDTGQLGL